MLVLRDLLTLLRNILALLKDILALLEGMINLLRDLLSHTEVILLKDQEVKHHRATLHPDLSLFANFVGLIDITWNHVNTMRSVRSVKALTT